ncbi:MAG: 2-dehydropantoate 2-reductase [Pseudomonadota bacterium]
MSQTAILGVGAIGGYLATQLLDVGADTLLFVRPARAASLAHTGLATTEDIQIAGKDLPLCTDPARLAEADRVLLCTKANALSTVVPTLQSHVRPDTPIFCMLNGVRAARDLAKALPDHKVVAGMVPYNIVERGPGMLHRSSAGEVVVESGAPGEALREVMRPTLSPIILAPNMDAVQYGKLLLNLNNPVNALSGLPIKAQLSDWHYRRVYALAFREALRVYKIAKVQHMQAAALPAEQIARVLMWPSFVFNRLALPRQDLDPDAQTSMAQDLAAGRKTEIDDLNGEVLRLATEAETTAPANAALVRLIKDAETGGRRQWDGPGLLKEIQKRN